MAEEKSLAVRASRGYFLSQATRIIEFGLVFVQSLIIARLLGPERQGYYATIIGFGNLVGLIGSLGFDEVANKYVAVLSDDIKKVGGLFSIILRLRFVIAFGISLSIFLLADRIAVALGNEILEPWIRLAAPMFLVNAVYSLMRFLYIGLLRIKSISIIQITNLTLTTLLFYIVLKKGMGINGLIIISIIVFLLTILFILLESRKIIFKGERPDNLRPMLNFGFFNWFNNIVGFLLGKQIDVLLLSAFKLPGEQIGFYHVGVGAARLISTITVSGLFGVSLSTLSLEFKRGGYEATKKAWWVLLKMSIGIAIPILSFVFVLGDDIITFFYGTEYMPAINLFRAFIIFHIVLRILGYDQHVTAIYSIGKERVEFLIRVIWGSLNLIGAIILIPILGVWGALIATGSALVGVVITEMIVIGRVLGAYFPLRFFLKVGFATLVSIIPVVFIPLDGLVAIFVGGILFVIILLGLLGFLKPFDKEDYNYLSKSLPRFEKYIRYFSRV